MLTCSSDFGSPYPGAMTGVIYERLEDRSMPVVDVTHDLPRGDRQASAFWLRELLPYYPPATHLVVVDPGVGSDRHAAVIRAGDHVLVGPDNGVLLPVARRLAGLEPGAKVGQSTSVDGKTAIEAFRIDEDRLERPIPTGGEDIDLGRSTFHGRDVFAPAAAAVANAARAPGKLPWLEDLSEPVEGTIPEAVVDGGDEISADVLAVDDFGNVITNILGQALEGVTAVVANGRRAPVEATFGAVDPGALVALVGSHGYVELDVNDGRGDEAFGLDTGDTVSVRLEGVEH